MHERKNVDAIALGSVAACVAVLAAGVFPFGASRDFYDSLWSEVTLLVR